MTARWITLFLKPRVEVVVCLGVNIVGVEHVHSGRRIFSVQLERKFAQLFLPSAVITEKNDVLESVLDQLLSNLLVDFRKYCTGNSDCSWMLRSRAIQRE